MKKFFVILLATSFYFHAFAQLLTKLPNSEYTFTVIRNMDATEVVSQGYTGTCWSYSTLSFLESELLRMGKGKVNLSEMFVARQAYIGKATNFFRYYGTFTFGQGGAFHDIPWVIENYGIMPEEFYTGLEKSNQVTHNHSKLEQSLTAFVKETIKKPNRKLNPEWKKMFTDSLNKYLGFLPHETEEFSFEVNGQKFTPKSYAKSLGLNMNDYVSLTSYTHHPFYRSFVLEVQDNWCLRSSYNLPLDELMQTMEHALRNGYTFAWGADVSEPGFSFRDALAILPDEAKIKIEGNDDRYFNSAGAFKISEALKKPVKEKWVTQQERQYAFDIQETTDDHGMHATGLAKDQNGTLYLIVKNSWGKGNSCGGYFYASFPYVRYKTMNILIHKNAIPKKIKAKLGIR